MDTDDTFSDIDTHILIDTNDGLMQISGDKA